MVIEPADFFDDDSFPSLATSAKSVGLFIFFEKLFPILLEEKFEVSDFLGALDCCLRNQGFNDEVCGKIQEACAEVVRIERQRKESEGQQNQQNNGFK